MKKSAPELPSTSNTYLIFQILAIFAVITFVALGMYFLINRNKIEHFTTNKINRCSTMRLNQIKVVLDTFDCHNMKNQSNALKKNAYAELKASLDSVDKPISALDNPQKTLMKLHNDSKVNILKIANDQLSKNQDLIERCNGLWDQYNKCNSALMTRPPVANPTPNNQSTRS